MLLLVEKWAILTKEMKSQTIAFKDKLARKKIQSTKKWLCNNTM